MTTEAAISGKREGKMSETKLYRTSDIYFAAYLCSLDFNLKTTESARTPEGNRKVVFVFTMSQNDLNKVKSSYFGGTGTAKARRFVDNIRSLKSMCFV
jgi:hypothetical protein